MLFSNPDVATVINLNFEPVWISVRPVPLVSIDFGDGNVVRRTLHGNVATYACDADGMVLDVLPGIYRPETYIERLRQMVLLHRYVAQSGPDARELTLRNYHEQQLESLDSGEKLELVERDLSIMRTERPLHVMLVPAHRMAARSAASSEAALASDRSRGPHTHVEETRVAETRVADTLEEDTRINESVRRRAIHQYLATSGPTQPEGMKKWLYREVLHADLDDPWLGLGPVLFGNYPFDR